MGDKITVGVLSECGQESWRGGACQGHDEPCIAALFSASGIVGAKKCAAFRRRLRAATSSGGGHMRRGGNSGAFIWTAGAPASRDGAIQTVPSI
jgi:hypothetical protein